MRIVKKVKQCLQKSIKSDLNQQYIIKHAAVDYRPDDIGNINLQFQTLADDELDNFDEINQILFSYILFTS